MYLLKTTSRVMSMSDQVKLMWTVSVMAVVLLLLGVDLVGLLLSSPQPVGFQLAFYMM